MIHKTIFKEFKMLNKVKKNILLPFFIIFFPISFLYGYDDSELLFSLMRMTENAKPEQFPKYSIYRKNDLLLCRGETDAAIANNKGVELIIAGQYSEAVSFFEKVLNNSALFLPFRFNLGVACYLNGEYNKALMHLNKARLLVPNYYMTYIHIGNVYDRMGKIEKSIIHFRKAARLNPSYIEALVLSGDGYFRLKRIDMAAHFYSKALEQDPFYNNAILGKSKIFFYKREYYKSYMNLKLINILKPYNKSYHYYMAECAYKLQYYDIAYKHYKLLISFKNDKFFLTVSLNLIEHKRDLAKKFAEQIKEGEDN